MRPPSSRVQQIRATRRAGPGSPLKCGPSRGVTILVVIGVLAACLSASVSAENAPAAVALTGVTVVDVREGRLLAEQTVVVRGERIVAVGSSRTTAVPLGARVVLASHKYLIPGLWDMHVHSQDDRLAREVSLPLY